MDVLAPRSLEEALHLKAERPDALPIEGGTDVMVELNFDRRRPDAILNLNEVSELRGWRREDGRLRLGAALTYTQTMRDLAEPLPALAEASRTVGSPQIRNRGTIGGNLGTASPAGDALPPLLVSECTVEVASVRGTRELPLESFLVGPKRNALEPDELILAAYVRPDGGSQTFMKVGTRNAMVIAVCSFALDLRERRVGTCIGSAAPTPLRAREAEGFAADALDWDGGGWDDAVGQRFGELVAAAASPIDDVRGSAAYRRHALGVLAARTLKWAWEERRCA
jgi:CO/xanthine dehydrogenase FAD-binding subunit